MLKTLKVNKDSILLISIFIFAFLIRFYQFSIFEFKNDQYLAIVLGNQTRAMHFLITHGMFSGVGINNPPLFLYFMGLLTGFTNSPYYLTLFFFGINIAALILAFVYFYRVLPKIYSFISSSLLALSPAFTIYSSDIWAQCLLPFLMIMFNIYLYKFVKTRRPAYLLALFVIIALAAQMHMSGFFIFPLLLILIIIYRKEINKRYIILALLILLIMFTPYIIYLFWGGQIFRFIFYGISLGRSLPWKALTEHLQMTSFDFFRHYFGSDFNSIVRAAVGQHNFILYPLTWIITIFFILGFFEYIKWLIRKRRFFDTDEEVIKSYPLPFQICGFIIIVITFCYFIFRVNTQMHYFIIFFPAYAVITGFSFYKFWRRIWARVLFFTGIISTASLLIFTLSFLERAGGHPYEYGLTYKNLVALKNELSSVIPGDYCPKLNLNFIGEGKTDIEATEYVLVGDKKCQDRRRVAPVRIDIKWDERLMKYVASVIKLNMSESHK